MTQVTCAGQETAEPAWLPSFPTHVTGQERSCDSTLCFLVFLLSSCPQDLRHPSEAVSPDLVLTSIVQVKKLKPREVMLLVRITQHINCLCSQDSFCLVAIMVKITIFGLKPELVIPSLPLTSSVNLGIFA